MESSETYAESGGLNCPICNCDDIAVGSLNEESGVICQDVCCPNCGASWSDIYTLTGYQDLVDPQNKDIESCPPT